MLRFATSCGDAGRGFSRFCLYLALLIVVGGFIGSLARAENTNPPSRYLPGGTGGVIVGSGIALTRPAATTFQPTPPPANVNPRRDRPDRPEHRDRP